MQESPAEINELFHFICRLLGGEEESWRCRLVSAQEIVQRLRQSGQANSLIRAARQRRPTASAERLAGDLVASLAETATSVQSEWHSLVEATHINGEWFLRLKPQRIPSHESAHTST
jgi:hypothetical protein